MRNAECEMRNTNFEAMDEKKEINRVESSLYEISYQVLHGLGESGLSDYEDAEFIDRATGKIHYTTRLVVTKDRQWTSDGERVFFNGFFYDFMSEELDPYFAVMDIKNKYYMHLYHGHAEHPRWNDYETDVLFDNRLEPASDKFALLENDSRDRDVERNLSVLHLENEKGFVFDGKKILLQSVSPGRTYMVCFFKVWGLWRSDFVVAFRVYRYKNGQWWRCKKWKMGKNMVNGVDRFGWVDDETIRYSASKDQYRWTAKLSNYLE